MRFLWYISIILFVYGILVVNAAEPKGEKEAPKAPKVVATTSATTKKVPAPTPKPDTPPPPAPKPDTPPPPPPEQPQPEPEQPTEPKPAPDQHPEGPTNPETPSSSSEQPENTTSNSNATYPGEIPECFPDAPMPWCGANGSMFTYSTLAASILVILFTRFLDIEF